MNHSAVALTGLIGWMLLLLLAMLGERAVLVLLGKKPANGFRPDGSDLPPIMQRLTRAHANCYESMPILGGVLLLALATRHTSITDGLALWLLAARIAQSSVHLISTSVIAVHVRFQLFIAQMLIATYWVVQLLVVALQG